MDSKDESEYLEHYGVLGMHWGIRRYQPYPKGHKGDGRYLGEAKRRLAQTGRVVSRTASKAGRAAVTKAKAARQAYKDAAPEREAKREARRDARFERRVSNRKEQAYQHPERLSDKELAARIARLEQEKKFKELSDDVIHPGKKRLEGYQDKIINKVIDKTVDKAIDKAFDAVGEKMKRPSELDKMQKQADLAKARADMAKSEADYRNQRNRLERLEDGSYEKSGKKGEKDYINEKASDTSSSNQNGGQTVKSREAQPSQAKSASEMTQREFEKNVRTQTKAENRAAKAEYNRQQESMRTDERSSSSWNNDDSYGIEKTSYWSSNGNTSTRVAVPRAVYTQPASSIPSSSIKTLSPSVTSTKLSTLSDLGITPKTGTSKGRTYVKTYMKNTDGSATGRFPDARYKKGYRLETLNR